MILKYSTIRDKLPSYLSCFSIWASNRDAHYHVLANGQAPLLKDCNQSKDSNPTPVSAQGVACTSVHPHPLPSSFFREWEICIPGAPDNRKYIIMGCLFLTPSAMGSDGVVLVIGDSVPLHWWRRLKYLMWIPWRVVICAPWGHRTYSWRKVSSSQLSFKRLSSVFSVSGADVVWNIDMSSIFRATYSHFDVEFVGWFMHSHIPLLLDFEMMF